MSVPAGSRPKACAAGSSDSSYLYSAMELNSQLIMLLIGLWQKDLPNHANDNVDSWLIFWISFRGCGESLVTPEPKWPKK